MGFLYSNSPLPLELLFGLVLICWAIYSFYTKDYDFWARRGVPYRKPSFPFGSMRSLFTGNVFIGQAYEEVYREFPDDRYCGVIVLRRPVLLIRDPDLIKHILVTDFNHFVDRGFLNFSAKALKYENLVAMIGEDWKNMRQKLTPAFSSGKIKDMFGLMVNCGEMLVDSLNKHSEEGNDVDIKETLSRFTMDIIATCAFGLETNCLINENTEFYQTGKSIFTFSYKNLLRAIFVNVFPSVAEIFKMNLIGRKPQQMIDSMVFNTIKYREENNVNRNDFIDILIKLKNDKSVLSGGEEKNVDDGPSTKTNPGIEPRQMTAQAFIFFAAGYETASSTMTFCLYELAQHQEVQQRLWWEIQEVIRKHGGQITYQALQEMKYMDQVISESLRMYASFSVIVRSCTLQYKIPGSNLVLEKGQKIYIPVSALHHDSQYYPEPYSFDPERFTPENIRARHPYVYLPFGAGPRNCIGMRFGLLQTKVGLASFLSRFRVEAAPETPKPMELKLLSTVTQSKSPVYLKVTRR